MAGMSEKAVGVAVLSVAALAAGCYYVFKVSVKLGWSEVLIFIGRNANLIKKIQRRKTLSRRKQKS